MQEQREEQLYQERREELRKAMREKYERAVDNSQEMIEGAKRMTNFVRNIFKGK